MPGRNEGEVEVAMVQRAAGIAGIDLVHAAARHIGGELVHGEELGAGLLADRARYRRYGPHAHA